MAKPLFRTVALGAALLTGLVTVLYAGVAGQANTRSANDRNFHLTDTAGQPYSIESFPRDLVLAIYFGYTSCLQACPTALDSIAAAVDALGPEGQSVRMVFIDMDPARAAMVSLPLYMESFGPGFIGLTGSPDDLAQAAMAFDVQVRRIQFSSDPTDYAMTHTSPIFIMRADEPRAVSLSADSPPEAIEAVLRTALSSRHGR